MAELKHALFTLVSRLFVFTLWIVAGGMLVLGAASFLFVFGNVVVVAGRTVLGV